METTKETLVAKAYDLLKHSLPMLEGLRHFYRLAYERGHYNSLRYKDFAERIDDIGRSVGRWIKSLPK